MGGRWDIVAIGSSGQWPTPGAGDWWHRMADAFDVICENGQPRVRIHGLRMLRKDIVATYPFYSCDSTNAAQNGLREALKNGVNNAAWGSDALARRIEHVQSPGAWSREVYETQGELIWSEA